MDDPTKDLPRYTWSESGDVIAIFRRIGLYRQEQVFTLAVRTLRPGTDSGKNAARLLPEAANALCEYLDRHDRE